MNRALNRRRFLQTTAQAWLAWALLESSRAAAAEPIRRAGKPRLLLSLAAYSFRDAFEHADPGKRITLFDFIDYCADNGCAGAELTSYYFPKTFDDSFLLQLKRRAFLRGVAVSGSAVGNKFTLPKGPQRDEQIALVKKWVDHCAILGAPHIRVFAGMADRQLATAEARKLAIEALEECGEYAGRKGIFLGLENHGGIVAEPEGLLAIVQAVKSPWVGVNLDTGNFQTEDPYADLAKCAPYAVNVQFKVEMHRRGGKQQEIADLPRVVRILRDANYQGYVALEHEKQEDPWQTVPGWLKKLREATAT